MRIIVHIEQIVVESDQPWSGGAEALAARTEAELARLITPKRAPSSVPAPPGLIALPRVSFAGKNGESVPQQLGVALGTVLDGVSR